MRILHIFDHSIPLHSGYTFRSLSILREQRALGWETFHLTSPKQKGGDMREETVDGWHFFRTPAQPSMLDALPAGDAVSGMRQTQRRLEQVVEQVRPDILHAHSPVLNALPALRTGARAGIPVVYEVRAFWEDAAVDHGTASERGLRYRLTRALETYALRRADAVTTICEGLRRDILARGIAASRVTVIPNAVDIEAFRVGNTHDAELKRSLGLDGAFVAGFIGSFYAYEGLDLLVRAMPAVLRDAPGVRLLLVGGGPQEANLKSLVRQLGLSDKVVFAGRVPHEDVGRYYDFVDVLVYPRHSMRLTELVTPLKPLEAMAHGKLLIASDVGGHRELIRDGETGILFKAGDTDALARTIVAIAAGTRAAETMRAAGRRFVETDRNWKASVRRYLPLYERLTAAAVRLAPKVAELR